MVRNLEAAGKADYAEQVAVCCTLTAAAQGGTYETVASAKHQGERGEGVAVQDGGGTPVVQRRNNNRNRNRAEGGQLS